MSIRLALVVEESGRATTVGPGVDDNSVMNTASAIARKIDHRDDGKKSFQDGGRIFNVLVSKGVVFIVASDEGGTKQRLLFQFLVSLRDEYFDRDVAELESTSKFRKYIESELDRYSNRPEEVDKLIATQDKVEQVKDVALANLGKLLERQERIEVTLQATERLQDGATTFNKLSRKQKCLECRRNIFYTIVLIVCCGILLLLILAIILILVFTLK